MTRVVLCVSFLLVACGRDAPAERQAPDPDAVWAWGRTFTGPSNEEEIDALTSDADGNVYISGKFEDRLEIPGHPALESVGAADIMVIALDSEGTVRWVEQLGGTGEDNVFDAAMDGSGRLVLSGWFGDTVDLGGIPVTSQGSQNGVVFALDTADGTVEWATPLASVGEAGGNEVSVAEGRVVVGADASDELVVEGTGLGPIPGTQSAHVIVLDAVDGSLIWGRRVSGGASRAKCIDTGPSGEVYLGGDFRGSVTVGEGANAATLDSDGGRDAYLTRWSAAGTLQWAIRWGGPGDDLCKAVAARADGEAYVAGTFERDIDFGPLSLSSVGGADQLVARLDGDGAPAWLVGLHSDADLTGSEAVVGPDGSLLFGIALKDDTTIVGADGTAHAIEKPGGASWPVLVEILDDGALGLASLPPLSDEAGTSEISVSGRRVYLDVPVRGGPFDFGEGELSVTDTKDAALVAIDLP